MNRRNPFILNVYSGPEYFCNRVGETLKIIDSLKNQRNITLISHRRMGKSGLIKHVFHKLRNDTSFQLFYVDIMDTENIGDLIELLAKEIIGKVDSQIVRVLKKFGVMVKSLRPKISVDQLTGLPEIEIDLQQGISPETSLFEIFNYLKAQKKQIIIAFDEFQQITSYPEKNIEALLRKHIQQLSNTNFIFSGSHKHLLLSMFGNYGKPFYQSSEMLFLDKIDRSTYKKFIKRHFKKAGRNVNQKALDLVFEYSQGHTFYVQYLCNKVYGTQEENIDAEVISETLFSILEENESLYYNFRNLLTHFQYKLLRAIAKEQGVDKPTSKYFIRKYDLGTPSSVKTGLNALITKELVYFDHDVYKVYDVFFSLWLARK
jgi:AAA+ ATPase superfamily predicted ATPase